MKRVRNRELELILPGTEARGHDTTMLARFCNQDVADFPGRRAETADVTCANNGP